MVVSRRPGQPVVSLAASIHCMSSEIDALSIQEQVREIAASASRVYLLQYSNAIGLQEDLP